MKLGVFLVLEMFMLVKGGCLDSIIILDGGERINWLQMLVVSLILDVVLWSFILRVTLDNFSRNLILLFYSSNYIFLTSQL